MKKTMKDHENFNAEHQHKAGQLEIKDSTQNFNASRMTTRCRASRKSLNEKLTLSQTFLAINSKP
jgi:hypothetical protein